MHRSARALIAAFTLLFVAAFAIVPAPARANMDRPTWAAGDFWVYTTGNASLPTTLRITVTGTQSVAVNGTPYSTYHTTADLTTKSGSFTVTYSADVWFSVDTLAIVEIQASINITGLITFTIAGNPPQTIQWPLTAGATWDSTTSIKLETRYPNGTTTATYQALSTHFEVQGDTSVTVPAGTFTTTPLKETNTANGTFTINYWSAQVGNWARIGEYDGSGRNQGNFNLTSFGYGGGNFFTAIIFGLPTWIWLVLLVIIVVAIIGIAAVRRRKPPTQPMPPPPAMPPQEPMGPPPNP